MAEKNKLFSRIQLKYDTYANWTATGTAGQGANLVLKAGEVGICAIPSGSTAVNGDTTRPQIMFKVGDGTSAFSALPWASAKAADVYDWAKQDEATFTTWVKGLVDIGDIDLSGYYKKTEVDTLLSTNSTNDQKYAKDYADALVAALDVTDTAVSGKYVSAVSQTDGKIAVTRASLPTYTLTTGTTNGTVKFNNTEVPVAGLGDAAYTDADAYATAAQGAKADSAVQSVKVLGETLTNGGELTVAEAKTALGLKSAAYTESSAYATAAQGTKADNAATQTALTEESDRAKAAEETNATAAANALAAAQAAQADIDAFLASADTSSDAIDTLKEIQAQLEAGDASAASLLSEINKIKDGTTTVGSATTATNATQLGGTAAANYLKKSEATGYGDILTKTAAASTYATPSDITDAIGALDSTVSATSGQYISAITQTDGKITATKTALPTYTVMGETLTDGGELTVAEAKTALGLGSAAYTSSGKYATAEQGDLADTALQVDDIIGTGDLITVTNIEFDEVTKTNLSYTSYGTATGLFIQGTLPTGFNTRYHVADVVVNGTTYEGVSVSQGTTSEYSVNITGFATGTGTITSIRFYSPGRIKLSIGDMTATTSDVAKALTEAKTYADELIETDESNYFVINCGTSTTVI